MTFFGSSPVALELMHPMTAAEFSQRLFIVAHHESDNFLEQAHVGMLLLESLDVLLKPGCIFRWPGLKKLDHLA
nr:hypothetical protein [Arcanobacterium haemolyticum]